MSAPEVLSKSGILYGRVGDDSGRNLRMLMPFSKYISRQFRATIEKATKKLRDSVGFWEK